MGQCAGHDARFFTGCSSRAPTHRPMWTLAVRRAIKVGIVIVIVNQLRGGLHKWSIQCWLDGAKLDHALIGGIDSSAFTVQTNK